MLTTIQSSNPAHTGFPFGRQFAHSQALASARIEGFEVGSQFKAAYADLAAGRVSSEEFRALIRVGVH